MRNTKTAPSDLILSSEAARILGISAQSVRAWANAGRLRATRTAGGVRVFSRAEVTFNAQGKFLLESKDQVKARLGRSPDRSDALACTFALAEMPKGMEGGRGSIGKVLIDFDPYAELPRRG